MQRIFWYFLHSQHSTFGLETHTQFSLSDDALHYIDLWLAPLKELKMFGWVTLKTPPQWKQVEAVMMKLNEQKLYDAEENATKLHMQFAFVKNYCTEAKIKQWRDGGVSTVVRWVELFNHLNVEGCEYKEITKMVEYVLCLPGTSASVERVFSAVNKSWTAEKTKLHIDTLKAILTIKCNLKLSCIDFYKYLISQPTLLRQIASKDKYKKRTENSEETELDNDSDDASASE